METLAILIPVRNGAHVIKNALDSIYNQTAFKNNKFNYEIFIVDNNSTDNLKEVIADQKNIHYLFCNIPGIVATLNTGIFKILSLPHIKYIARLDDDDKWVDSKIDIQFSYMLQNPDIDICGTGIRFIRGDDYQDWKYSEKHNDIIKELDMGRNPFAHPAVIYKKDIFYKCGGYDETCKYTEDLNLWIKASKHYKFHNMQEILLHYNYEVKDDKYIEEQKNNTQKLYIQYLILNDKIKLTQI